jgi:hypothetical protein
MPRLRHYCRRMHPRPRRQYAGPRLDLPIQPLQANIHELYSHPDGCPAPCHRLPRQPSLSCVPTYQRRPQHCCRPPLSFAGHDCDKPQQLAADNPSDHVLTQQFNQFLPSQIPENFAISQLPPEILSWMSQVLQIAESSLICPTRAQMRRTTGSGADGFPFANAQASLLTPTSLLYSTMKASSSSEPS